MSGRTTGNRLAVAKARAEAARARLANTIGALQERAKPRSLVHDVTETLKDRGSRAVTGLADAARAKPVHTGAVLAGIGLFLARRRIARLARRATARPAKSPLPKALK